MKLLLLATLCVCAAVAASHRDPCLQPGPPSQTPLEAVILDPQTIDAATVDDLRHAGKDAVCHVAASTLDLVQLCRDKGFESVVFDDPSAQLRERAAKLKLRVVDSAGRKTTTGS